MKRLASVGLAAGVLTLLIGCGDTGLGAHAETVAKVGAQELTVKRVSEMLGNSKLPLKKDVIRVIADLWVNYQLLGQAGAKGDSLTDAKQLDSALWAPIANTRARKFYEVVSKTWAVQTPANGQAMFDAGDIMAARHILFMVPKEGVTPQQKQQIRDRADSLRRILTAANFAQLAGRFSQDQGTARQGGELGAFPKGMMVPEFENALKNIKPGEISPVVESRFGYHIILRQGYNEVVPQVASLMQQRGAAMAESTYWARLEQANTVTVKTDAPKMVRDVAADPDAFRDSKMVIGNTKRGDFTAAQLSRWLSAYPPEQGLQQQIANAPDTATISLVKNFIRNELFLAQADSAKVDLTAQEREAIRSEFRTMVLNSWTQLGVSPSALADSAKTPEARATLAAKRVDAFLDNMIVKDGQFLPIARSLDQMLKLRYPGAKIVDAGIDRALEAATKLRATADSIAKAGQPASAVPVPNAETPAAKP